MRRAIPVILATCGGLALVANFHTRSTSVALSVGAAPAPTTTATSSPSGPASGFSSSSTTAGVAAASSSSSSSAAPTTTAAAGAGGASRTVDGPLITTGYGPVQVRVTLEGQHIVDVQALQLPSDRSRSARISQSAGPLLRSEALQAQSANIDVVSGASYTSEGYVESLQGALDRGTR